MTDRKGVVPLFRVACSGKRGTTPFRNSFCNALLESESVLHFSGNPGVCRVEIQATMYILYIIL